MTTFTREDFEMAARAAGLYLQWPEPDYSVEWNGQALWCSGEGMGELWIPPDDDGDALRLAAALHLRVFADEMTAEGVGFVTVDWDFDDQFISREQIDERFFSDAGKLPAMRIAIFRAAIAIGRAMLAPDARPTDAPGLPSPGETAPDQQLETLKTPDWRCRICDSTTKGKPNIGQCVGCSHHIETP